MRMKALESLVVAGRTEAAAFDRRDACMSSNILPTADPRVPRWCIGDMALDYLMTRLVVEGGGILRNRPNDRYPRSFAYCNVSSEDLPTLMV